MKKAPAMSSKERVHAAVKGLPVDRVPVMHWLEAHAGVKLVSEFFPGPSGLQNFLIKKMWKYFKNKGALIWVDEEKSVALPFAVHFYLNQDYVAHLGSDCVLFNGGKGIYGDDPYYFENGKFRVKDIFGGVRGIGGIYIENIRPAVQNINDLVNLALPDVSDDRYFAKIRKFRKEHPEISILAEHYGPQDSLNFQLWEMSKVMMAYMDYPEEVKAFQKRFVDWQIQLIRKSIRAGADIIFIGEDYGFNNRPLMSMEMWKEFSYPGLRRLIDAVHEEGALFMLHSCGYQKPFLDYYAEAGLDILQSVQPNAGNNFAEIYAQYGDRLAFATGIDTQVGERMSPAELREDIIGAYNIGGRKGRHILGMTHYLQYTMPDDNVSMLFKTVREIQEGVHG